MESMVETLVKQRIDQMDIEYIVRDSVRGLVTEQAKAAIKPIMDKELSIIISKEIESIFTTEVKTDDGWGNSKIFPTFEELFKSEFKRKLNDQYQIKTVINTLVKERVTSLINQDYAKVVETIVDTLTASKLVKKP
jgi:uncharacterized membrane protein YheB (UPF0754 family)